MSGSGSIGSWSRVGEAWRHHAGRRADDKGETYGERPEFVGGGNHNRSRRSRTSWRKDPPFAEEDVVADMKLVDPGEIEPSLHVTCPRYEDPTQVCCYSRSSDGSIHWDDRGLRQFRSDVVSERGADLMKGYDSFQDSRGDTLIEDYHLGVLLATLRAKKILLDNIHFVTFRANLNKMLETPYTRQPWKMGVHKRGGIIYLHVHKIPEPPITEWVRRNCYCGLSFQHLATEKQIGATSSSKTPGQTPDEVVDANVAFNVVLQSSFGSHRILMGAQMHCYEPGEDGKKEYVMLRTALEVGPQNRERFEKHKLLKYWIPSYLAGVQRIVCGFRDDSGRILGGNQCGCTNCRVCLTFAHQVLSWLYGSAQEGEDYLLEFVPEENRLVLLRRNSCPDVINKHWQDSDSQQCTVSKSFDKFLCFS